MPGLYTGATGHVNVEDTNAGPLGRTANPLPDPLLCITVNILKFHYPGFPLAALDLTLSNAAPPSLRSLP